MTKIEVQQQQLIPYVKWQGARVSEEGEPEWRSVLMKKKMKKSLVSVVQTDRLNPRGLLLQAVGLHYSFDFF